ncbi:NADP-dependent oxidoreductase [Paenibacillus sp. 8b26]|uniref:NADP-dependent oxidoreductase n=1 Tax=Paenibacillus sp. 8b26 TaxID=3424133 RepID=UPI003D65EAE6
MRKILLNEYGTVDVLHEIKEPVPTPGKGEIQIKLVATSVNDTDILIRQNGPFPTMPKELRPILPHMLGVDFSGIITAVGEGVSKYHVGDHVIGLTMSGTYAEYLILDENSLLAKVPSDLDLVPLGGLYVTAATAWAAIVSNGKVESGQKVLIHGAAGGVGSMAAQLAKHFGASVIGTAGSYSKEYLVELGVDEVIDYRSQDFTKLVSNVDLVVNITGPTTLEQSYQVVKKGGRLTSTNGVPDKEKAAKMGIEASYTMGMISPEDLTSIIRLYSEGILKLNITKKYRFTLDSIKQAHLDFEKGPNQGKRIIEFDKNE